MSQLSKIEWTGYKTNRQDVQNARQGTKPDSQERRTKA